MKLSIIIPVHNNEETIAKCVCSIVEQENINTEILLIENNSNDCSLTECNILSKKYPNIIVKSTTEVGVSNARNIGLMYCTGEIITFCDADDYLEPNTLPKVLELFEEYNPQIVCTGLNIEYKNKKISRKSRKQKIISSSKMLENVLCNPIVMGSVCNKFYRKSIIRGIKFDTNLTHLEDGYFNVEVLCSDKNADVLICDIITYCYVVNSISATNDYSKIFGTNGELKYVTSLKQMNEKLCLSEKEKTYVCDNIFRISVDVLFNNEIKKDKTQYEMLINNVKENYITFGRRLFKYDIKTRMKILLKATYILIRRIN